MWKVYLKYFITGLAIMTPLFIDFNVFTFEIVDLGPDYIPETKAFINKHPVKTSYLVACALTPVIMAILMVVRCLFVKYKVSFFF